jgi:MFS superfamily sulfate permease-like transporter
MSETQRIIDSYYEQQEEPAPDTEPTETLHVVSATMTVFDPLTSHGYVSTNFHRGPTKETLTVPDGETRVHIYDRVSYASAQRMARALLNLSAKQHGQEPENPQDEIDDLTFLVEVLASGIDTFAEMINERQDQVNQLEARAQVADETIRAKNFRVLHLEKTINYQRGTIRHLADDLDTATAERNQARSELTDIRYAVHADPNESTFDEVYRAMWDLRRKLARARWQVYRAMGGVEPYDEAYWKSKDEPEKDGRNDQA